MLAPALREVSQGLLALHRRCPLHHVRYLRPLFPLLALSALLHLPCLCRFSRSRRLNYPSYLHREVVAEHRVIQFEQMQLTSSRYLSLLWDLLRGYQTDRYASHLYLRHLDGYQACRLVRLADRQT